ncbi:LysM peptidoglycan-binding domain-containing protein [Streptomyces sp. 8N706]|uniref:LysM peptidoglycan-binding domain-containing protein n=1 Tax=Streptomyces sp. 8N706 TaxID=3457416 RepID=UPI003FD44C65
MPTSPPASTSRSPLAVLRAAGSLLLLLIAVGGLPLLLGWATPVLWENGQGELTHLLDRQDTGGLFLLVLVAIAWAGWAHFTYCVVMEIPAQVRGRTRRPRRGLAISRRAAATLVGSILVLLPTSTAPATPTTATAAPSAPALPGTDNLSSTTAQGHQGNDTQVPQETGQRQATYTVRQLRPAESLWSIADRELGDGERWREIADLNQGRTMTDGTLFNPDNFLQPGWKLLMPEDTAERDHARPQGGAARSVTVQTGDSLSRIADRELGDATQWPAIFEENRDEPQPGGGKFTDPDSIYPGQELDLPSPRAAEPSDNTDSSEVTEPPDQAGDQAEDQDTATPQEKAPHEHNTAPAKPSHPAQEPPAASPEPTAPAEDEKAAPTPTEQGETSAGTSSHTPAPRESAQRERAAHADEADDSALNPALALAGVGVLLASGLVGTLATKRLLQQRRRKAGETIAIDEETPHTEQALNAAADTDQAALLDRALRTLADHARAAGHTLPTLRGAHLTARSIELLLEDPAEDALPPFTLGDSGRSWILDPAAPLLTDDAREVPAPYPGLVTIGSTEEDGLLLANLLHHRAVLLNGPETDALAVARALVLEAGTARWTDYTQIVTVGLGTQLAALLPQGRIGAMPHLQSAVRDLGEYLLETRQHTDEDPDTVPLPWILIAVGDIEHDHAWQLAEALSAAADLPVALVLPSTDITRQFFPDAEHLSTEADTAQTPDSLGLPVRIQRLEEETYREYTRSLVTAEEPARPATGAWQLAADHHTPATQPQRTPPLSLLLTGEGHDHDAQSGASDAPFPALLASSDPARIRLITPTEDLADKSSSGPTQAMASPDTVAGAGQEDTGVEASAASGPGQRAPVLTPAPSPRPEPEPEPTDDPNAPLIQVLGPVSVTGITSSGHDPRLADLAVLMRFKPGRTADQLRSLMDPASPWTKRTLQARASELRMRLGEDSHGNLYLPRTRAGYQLGPAVRMDWDHFQRLAQRGLTGGPQTGLPDLEDALALVRGRPFADRDYPWAAPIEQQMISRIVDVAHTVATWRTEGPTPDLDEARRAVQRGLKIDETAEVLYRDWIHIEAAADNEAGIRKAAAQITRIAHAYDIDLEPQTEQTINRLLTSSNRRPQANSR